MLSPLRPAPMTTTFITPPATRRARRGSADGHRSPRAPARRPARRGRGRGGRRSTARPRRAPRSRRAARGAGRRRRRRDPGVPTVASRRACCGPTRSLASASSTVGLPSRRSSPTGLPVVASSPKTPSRSSRSWKASPSGRPKALNASTRSASAPARAAPRCKGRSTVYAPDLYRATRRARSTGRPPRHAPTTSRYWPIISSVRSSSQTAPTSTPRGADEPIGAGEGQVADKDADTLTEPSSLPPPPGPAMGLVERAMQRRLAATSGRAVHDVVVEEGEAVQQLDAGGDVQPASGRADRRPRRGSRSGRRAGGAACRRPASTASGGRPVLRTTGRWRPSGRARAGGRRGGGPRPRRR